MENNLLIIGNGFDLYHGLKTKYADFAEKMRELLGKDCFKENDNIKKLSQLASRNSFIHYLINTEEAYEGWIDFENEMEEVIEILSDIIKYLEYSPNLLHNLSINSERLKMPIYKIMKISYFNDYFYITTNSNKVKCELRIKYIDENGKIRKNKLMEELKKELDGLISALRIYMLEFVCNQSIQTISKQIEKIHPNYVINFNYTNTYCQYGIKEEDVFYIHGSIEKNNMVLGIKDKIEDNLDFIYFKKYFQRIQKHTGMPDFSKIELENENLIPISKTAHFYGHSLDNTDGDMIREIEELVDKMVIYVLNQEDYERKVINLISVFGKKKAIEMIQKVDIEFVDIK